MWATRCARRPVPKQLLKVALVTIWHPPSDPTPPLHFCRNPLKPPHCPPHGYWDVQVCTHLPLKNPPHLGLLDKIMHGPVQFLFQIHNNILVFLQFIHDIDFLLNLATYSHTVLNPTILQGPVQTPTSLSSCQILRNSCSNTDVS